MIEVNLWNILYFDFNDMLPQIDRPGIFGKDDWLDTMSGCDPFLRISMDGPK